MNYFSLCNGILVKQLSDLVSGIQFEILVYIFRSLGAASVLVASTTGD